jgi:hypothetical protein
MISGEANEMKEVYIKNNLILPGSSLRKSPIALHTPNACLSKVMSIRETIFGLYPEQIYHIFLRVPTSDV